MTVRDDLRAAVEAVVPQAIDLSHRVHAHPEIAFQERQAAAWTAELLSRHGFTVEAPVAGLETAFVARRPGGRPGPVIAYLGEYDALPEVGHGCGHNLMCSTSAGAAIALASVLGEDEFAGEVRFIGTPAEEAGSGKVTMIERGVFDDVDIALQIHPSDKTNAEILCLAITEVQVAYHGKLAHASADPWLGRNALDALVLLYTMVAQWRQHLKPGERVHGIITHGGAAPNIVPDLTSGRWFLRTPVDADLQPMVDRFTEMAEAAARATGTTVEVTEAPNRMRTMRNNQALLEIWRRELEAAGWQDGPIDPNAGSTDMANVSHEVPTIHPMMAIAPEGTPGHSREFAAYAVGPGGDEMLPVAIRTLAGTGLALLRDPALVERAWSELRAAGGGREAAG